MLKNLIVYGINHQSAPIKVRERLAFSEGLLNEAFTTLTEQQAANETVILSTCNRTEIYSYSDHCDAKIIEKWVTLSSLRIEEVTPYIYRYDSKYAVRHLFRVAAGLDSMVTGEVQILGQLKNAYQKALEHNALGSHLLRLFQYAFSVVKTIRTETGISENAVSIAYCAIRLAKLLFADLKTTKALLIGAGDTIELLLRYLTSELVAEVCVINRSQDKAEQLVELYGGKVAELGDLPKLLPTYDLIFTATASALPLIGKGMVEHAVKVRRSKPLFMIDLAVPRDIESQVGQLEDVFLYTVDDLQHVIKENLQHRKKAAFEAEQLIDFYVEEYCRWHQSLTAVKTIRQIRENVESYSQQEVSRALKKLQHGHMAENVVLELSHRLVNKIMHLPTVKLREAGLNGDAHTLALAEWLFKQSEHHD